MAIRLITVITLLVWTISMFISAAVLPTPAFVRNCGVQMYFSLPNEQDNRYEMVCKEECFQNKILYVL